MSIIPIAPNSTLSVDDGSGNKFRFRYLTGENYTKYNEIQNEYYEKGKPYIKIAESQLKKEGIKKPDPREIAKRCLNIAKSRGDISDADDDRHMEKLINLFLVDWDVKGAPKRDNCKLPSEHFQVSSMIALMELLAKNLEQLIGLTVADQKN